MRAQAALLPEAHAEEIGGTGFSVKQFISNFEVLASAPGGAERLRAMTLHLAIRGALTNEQRVGGAPASVTDGLQPPFELPSGWAWRQVKEVGDLKLGRQRAPSNHHGPNMRPYLRVANVQEARIDISDVLEMNFEPDEAARFLLEAGDVLLNEGQSYELVGRPAIYRGEIPGACFQNTLIRFRPSSETVLSEFALIVFRAYMRTGRFRQEAQQTTNIAHLSLGRLSVIEFPLPPLPEQKRIVAKAGELMRLLDDMEGKQAKKQQTETRLRAASLSALISSSEPAGFATALGRVTSNFDVLFAGSETVQVLRRAIFGIGCRGSLVQRNNEDGTGRDVLRNVGVERKSWASTASERGNREVSRLLSKLDEQTVSAPNAAIPEHWVWTTLLAVCQQVVDCHNKTAPYSSSGISLVRTSNIRDGKLLLNGVKYVSQETYARWSQRCPPAPGDVIFTREAPMGEAAVIGPGLKLCLGQRTMLLRPFTGLLDPKFLLIAIRDPAFQARMTEAAVGSTVKHLRVGDVESLWIPLPPFAEQLRIVAKVEHLMMLCDELEDKLLQTEDAAAKVASAVVAEVVG